MSGAGLHGTIRRGVALLQRFVDRLWYPPLVGLLAALDNLLVVIPTDGILISSAMLKPRRWFVVAVCVAVGSTAGAVFLAALVEYQGLPWILGFFPGLDQSPAWQWTERFFQEYGLLMVFAVAATPFVQQPSIILASLAKVPLLQLAAVIFLGRVIKFLIMSYVGSHAPALLGRMWGLKGELKDAGVDVDGNA